MEIVTGKAGVPHVSSADDGRRIAGEVGTGSYVLQTGGKLAPSLVDANTVRIATGDMIVQGRHIGVTVPEDVKVASGSQGKKRMDYICVHYTRDVSGSSPTLVETVEWKVLQGTPGSSATAPSVPKGSILDGNADVTVPICSVTFDGLTTGQPKLLIPELTPLADLGDSVSQGRDPSLDRSGIAEGWNYSLVHIERDNYMLTIQRTLNPTPAYAEFILPFHLETTVRLWGRLMVATTYVGTTTASIDTNGIVRVSGSGYGAPATTDLYGLVILA